MIDQSKSPPISISYSSAAGGGGGGACFYYFFSGFFLSATGAWTGAEVAAGADPPPTDPKKSATFLPFKAFPNALTNVLLTLTPAAFRTAFKESAVT